MKWDDLNLFQKSDLMKLYIKNGMTSLDEMKNHYNSFQNGGKPSYRDWIKTVNPRYLGEDYDLEAAYNNLPYQQMEAWRLDPERNHLSDAYKKPSHRTFSDESVYSRGPMIGGSWSTQPTATPWYDRYIFTPTTVNQRTYPDIYKENRPYTEGEIYNFAVGGKLGHKYQDGGPDDDKIYASSTVYTPTEGVNIVDEHPLWSYPDYKRLKNNPNIQRHKDALYTMRRNHERAGVRYLKAVGQTASALSYLTGLGEAAVATQLGIKGLIKTLGKEITRNAPQYIMQTPDVIMDVNDPDAVSLILDSPGRIMSKVDDAIPLGKFNFIKYLDNFIPELGAAYDAYGAIKTISNEEEN